MRTCTYNLEFEMRQKQNECKEYDEAEKVVKKYVRLIDEVQKNFYCPRKSDDKCGNCRDNVRF